MIISQRIILDVLPLSLLKDEIQKLQVAMKALQHDVHSSNPNVTDLIIRITELENLRDEVCGRLELLEAKVSAFENEAAIDPTWQDDIKKQLVELKKNADMRDAEILRTIADHRQQDYRLAMIKAAVDGLAGMRCDQGV
jgi:chromosome segregation ATPase